MSRAIPTSRPLRLGTALALVAAIMAVGPTASAAAPVKVSFPVDISYPLDDLSAVCGFDVEFSMVGLFKGTLFVDRSGVIVGEFDSQPNTTITFSSPENGTSYSYKFSTTFHNRYPEGLEPGDLAIASATGFLEKVPGLPAQAGRLYFPNGEVLFVDDGVPITDYGEPTIVPRDKYSGDELDAAICAYLGG
jgi:hypothetical protein